MTLSRMILKWRVKKIVKSLEKRGILEQTPDGYLKLTEKGLKEAQKEKGLL